MKKYVNPELEASRNVIDAIREICGQDPLYEGPKETPSFSTEGYMNGIGDGSKRIESSV